MICRLSLRTASSSYTASWVPPCPLPHRWPGSPPKWGMVALETRIQDTLSLLFVPWVLAECTAVLCLHFPLQNKAVMSTQLWAAPRGAWSNSSSRFRASQYKGIFKQERRSCHQIFFMSEKSWIKTGDKGKMDISWASIRRCGFNESRGFWLKAGWRKLAVENEL